MTRPSHPGTRIARYLVCFLMFFSFLSPLTALAEILPTFTRLPPISAQIKSPTGVALDRQGRLYVVETKSNRVKIFAQNGRFLHAITGLQEPVSVAASEDGKIYIGNKKKGNVSVFDSKYSLLFKLGQGDGEFAFPCSITVDSLSHIIYVADRENSTVRAYNQDGSFNSILGQAGNGNGQFIEPISLAIDAVAAELIVLDQQQKPDTFYGIMINGARIQFFDLNGNFLRGYTKAGYKMENGDLARPVHIAVDKASRLYITDSLWQKVLVYDNNDTFLGQLHDPSNPFRLPLGISIGLSDRLYTASFLGNRVEVFGIGDYTAMDISSPTLSFETVEGGSNPDPETITINNTGRSPFSLTVSSSESRLIVPETSTPILANDSQTIMVGYDTQGLPPGTYESSLDITAGESGVSETVRIFLTVLDNPLQIDPKAVTIRTEAGTSPEGQTVSVSTGRPDSVSWTAAADQNWLTLSRVSGDTPVDVRIYAATESLSAGTYTGSVTFSSMESDPAPVKIAVTLHLTDPGAPPVEPPVTPVPGHGKNNIKWSITQVTPGTALNGVWGSSPRDVYAVGAAGTILHRKNNKWEPVDTGSSTTLHSIWGSASNDIYAVGDQGLVLHYDGSKWAPAATVINETLHDVSGTENDVLSVTYGSILHNKLTESIEQDVALRSIWGSSDTDIFVTGEAGAILHYDGTDWIPMVSGTDQWLNSVWGSSASDVFAVGEKGIILHYDGAKWITMESGTSETLFSVWGSSESDVYAVGTNGIVLHFTGSQWDPVESGAEITLNDVWLSSKSEIFAVGEDGFILTGKSTFPWLHFITNTILVNAASGDDEEDNKSDKGLMPTKIVVGTE